MIAQARAGLCHQKSRKQPSRARTGTGDGQLVAQWQRHTGGGPGHRSSQGIMAPRCVGTFRSWFLCEAGPGNYHQSNLSLQVAKDLSVWCTFRAELLLDVLIPTLLTYQATTRNHTAPSLQPCPSSTLC